MNEKLYKRLGFSTEFVGEGYVLDELVYGIKQAVRTCVQVKESERVLILKDRESEQIADSIISEVKEITDNLGIYSLEDYDRRPREIPKGMLDDVRKSDVLFVITRYYPGEMSIYGPLNKICENSNIKYVVMMDLDEKLLIDGMGINYEMLRDFSRRVYSHIKDARKIRVKTRGEIYDRR